LLHEFNVPNASFSADVLGCLPPEGWAITEDLIGEERRGMTARRDRKEMEDLHVLFFFSFSLMPGVPGPVHSPSYSHLNSLQHSPASF
jgi:hypothetical protein